MRNKKKKKGNQVRQKEALIASLNLLVSKSVVLLQSVKKNTDTITLILASRMDNKTAGPTFKFDQTEETHVAMC